MSSIKFVEARCKICGFTTSDSEKESVHTVAESITYQQGISRKTREILKVIHDIHPISVNDAEEIFSQIMELEGEKFKFKLIDCMEIVK